MPRAQNLVTRRWPQVNKQFSMCIVVALLPEELSRLGLLGLKSLP